MGDLTTAAFVFFSGVGVGTAATFLLGKAWRFVSSHMAVDYATSPPPTLWTALVWYRHRAKWEVMRAFERNYYEEGK